MEEYAGPFYGSGMEENTSLLPAPHSQDSVTWPHPAARETEKGHLSFCIQGKENISDKL